MGASNHSDRRRRPRQLILVIALAASLLAVVAPAASGQTGTRCAALFPEAEWLDVPGAGIDLGVSAVPSGQIPRFRDEVRSIATAAGEDIGGLEGSAVCIVGPESAFDGDRYVPQTRRFHAAVDGPNDVVVLSSENPGNIRPASAFGIPHLALWNLSGGAGWPEPLASAIGQWYRAIALDRMAQYRVESTGADFSVNSLTGEGNFGLDFSTEPRIEWTETVQQPVLTWDPETNESPIGYFIEYTVENEGIEVLADTDPDAWTEREGRWRTSLYQDLTGRTTPTMGWMVGLAIAIVLVIVASTIAIHGFVTKRRRNRRRETASTQT